MLQSGEIERLGGTQVRKVDVRMVAATNVDLEKAVAEGRFRRDLLYRLNIYPIRIPPLRERTDDIELIAMHLLQKYAVQHGKRMVGFTDRALLAMRAHAWPGNVRELENLRERGVILTPSDESVDADVLFPHITMQPGATLNAAGALEHAAAPTAQSTQLYDTLQSSGLTLEALEDTLIREAVARAGGNLSAAARALGLTRPQLSYRLSRLNERAQN